MEVKICDVQGRDSGALYPTTLREIDEVICEGKIKRYIQNYFSEDILGVDGYSIGVIGAVKFEYPQSSKAGAFFLLEVVISGMIYSAEIGKAHKQGLYLLRVYFNRKNLNNLGSKKTTPKMELVYLGELGEY